MNTYIVWFCTTFYVYCIITVIKVNIKKEQIWTVINKHSV